LEGLQVVDTNNPTLNAAAKTMNLAVAIAEKAADNISIKELGLS
jgi:hypothetical protein